MDPVKGGRRVGRGRRWFKSSCIHLFGFFLLVSCGDGNVLHDAMS